MSIPKYVKSIFDDVDNFPEEGLTQKEIVHKVLKFRNKPINYETEKQEQPNVAKALKKLLEANQIFLTNERTYYPVTQETAQKEALTQFSENVYCVKGDIYAVVDTMYLIKVHSDHVFVASEYLRRYLGPDRYFDIFYSNSYLWVLWVPKDNDDEEEFLTVYREISNAVAISYERYIDSQKKLIKLQKNQASKVTES